MSLFINDTLTFYYIYKYVGHFSIFKNNPIKFKRKKKAHTYI